MEKNHALYIQRFPVLGWTYGGEPSDSFLQHLKWAKGVTQRILIWNKYTMKSGSSDFYKIPNLGKTRDIEYFRRLIFHTEKVDKLFTHT